MKLARKNLEKNLPKKGFEKKLDGDHIRFLFVFENKYTAIRTKVSHTQKMKDISGGLLTEIRKQLSLDSNKEVLDLCNCPMSEQDYIDVLRKKNLIP